jgi:hypothetical protein
MIAIAAGMSFLTVLLAVPVAEAAPPHGAISVPPATVYGKLLSNLEREVVGAAQAMPADKFGFAPTKGNFAGVRTYGQQIKHITEANYGILSGFGIKPDVDPKTINGLTSKDDIVKALQGSFAYAHKCFDTINAGNAFVVLDSKSGRETTRAGLATMMMVHTNDHYGQMVEYLRMNGIIPPASRK